MKEFSLRTKPDSIIRKLVKSTLLAVSILCGLTAAALSQASSPDYSSLFIGVLQLWGVHIATAVMLFCISSRRAKRFYPIYLIAIVLLAIPVIEMGGRVL